MIKCLNYMSQNTEHLSTKHSHVLEKHIKLGKMRGGGSLTLTKVLCFFTFAICTGMLLYSTVLLTLPLVWVIFFTKKKY